jgi:DNA repair protein RadC
MRFTPHGEPAHEEFWVVALDRRNRPTAVSLVGKGGIHCALVNPREVLEVPLLSNATSISTT